MLEIAKVTSKNQITLPKDVCKVLNICQGDKIVFKTEDGKITISKAFIDKNLSIDNGLVSYDLIVPVTQMCDYEALNEFEITDEVFNLAFKCIYDGGRVIVEKRCVNSPSQIVSTFSTIEEVNAWRSEWLENRKNLKKK